LLEQRAALTKENKGVEILLFYFVFQVDGFDLEEAEGAKDLGDLCVLGRLNNVEKARYVLLDINFDF